MIRESIPSQLVECSGSQEQQLPIEIQGLCGCTMDCCLWIAHRGSQWWNQCGGFCVVWADRGAGGGPCVALALGTGGGPGPRQWLVVAPGGRWWTVTEDWSRLWSGCWIVVLLVADHGM